MDLDYLIRPSFKVGEIIRHKLTGQPYRVIHIYKYYGTILIDLTDRNPLATTLTLKPCYYEDYAPDRDMKMVGDWWQYQPVSI